MLLLALMYVVIPLVRRISVKQLLLALGYLWVFAMLWMNFYLRGASRKFLFGAAIFSLAITSLYLRLTTFCPSCGKMHFNIWLFRKKQCMKCGAALKNRAGGNTR